MNDKIIPLDLTYLYTLTEGNQKFTKLLLTSAIQDIKSKMTLLIECWRLKDAGGLRQAAHSLISLAAIAGMPLVSEWCRELEHAFTEQNFQEDMAPIVENIVEVWSDAQPQLIHLIKS
ncbi:MAG: Hpt domain-containing protein [Chitinophagaceae bacterium]